MIAVDLLEARLQMARELGADEVVNVRTATSVAPIRRLTGGRGVDMAIDCSGTPAGQNAALDTRPSGARVAFVGESRSTEINPSDQIIRKLLTVVGGWYFPLWEWAEIVRFVAEQELPVERS